MQAAAARRARRASRPAARAPAADAGRGAQAPPAAGRRGDGSSWDAGQVLPRLRSSLRGQLHADSAITDEAAGLVEHGLPTDLESLARTVRIEAAENEIQERLASRDDRLQAFALGLVPAARLYTAWITDAQAL